jgi:hypothetical protein
MTATEGLAAMLGLAAVIFGIADMIRVPAHRSALAVRLIVIFGAVIFGWSIAPLIVR